MTKKDKPILPETLRKAEYYGYTVYEDGRIFNRHKRQIRGWTQKGLRVTQFYRDGGKRRRTITVARLVYAAFNPDFDIDDRSVLISPLDGDVLNVRLDNLQAVARKDLIQGEKSGLAQISDEDADEIRRLYSGSSGPNQYDKAGYSLQDLANLYGVTKSAIWQIVQGRVRKKENYKLK